MLPTVGWLGSGKSVLRGEEVYVPVGESNYMTFEVVKQHPPGQNYEFQTISKGRKGGDLSDHHLISLNNKLKSTTHPSRFARYNSVGFCASPPYNSTFTNISS